MDSNEAKLDEIRRAARQEVAQSKQREESLKGKANRPQPGINFGWFHMLAVVVLVFGVMTVYIDKRSTETPDDWQTAGRAIGESYQKAVQIAALQHLAEQGVDIKTVTDIDATTLAGGDVYSITARTAGTTYRMTAQAICQSFSPNVSERQRASCYTWR